MDPRKKTRQTEAVEELLKKEGKKPVMPPRHSFYIHGISDPLEKSGRTPGDRLRIEVKAFNCVPDDATGEVFLDTSKKKPSFLRRLIRRFFGRAK